MRHKQHYPPRINAQNADIAPKTVKPVDAHAAYLESLGTINALMTFWINYPDNPGEIGRQEISDRLEAMVQHAKEGHCPLCPLAETRDAEERFWTTAELYLNSPHRRAPSSLVEIVVDHAEDGVSDPLSELPFADLLSLINGKKTARSRAS
jgi:hypothetical protein